MQTLTNKNNNILLDYYRQLAHQVEFFITLCFIKSAVLLDSDIF